MSPREPLEPSEGLLPGRCLVDTSDVDETRRVFGRLYAESHLEPPSGGPFGCRLDLVAADVLRIVAGDWRNGGQIVVPELGDMYVLNLTTDGAIHGTWAGVPYEGTPGTRGVLLSPGAKFVIDAPARHRGHAFTLERGALDAHFRALTGCELRGPLHFDPGLDIASGPGAVVAEVATALRREASRRGASRLLLAGLRDALLTSVLTNARHDAAALLGGAPARAVPRSVRRAEEYIEAHAAGPITLADVAAAAGVTLRALQAGFRAHRGVTPMEWLRERRLDLARERLAHATPETTVASVVRALGLGDAGRFSGHYRARFGESPSATLARAGVRRR